MYTFHLYTPQGVPLSFEAFEVAGEGEAFAAAGRLLDEHLSCDHVEVWDGDRAVLARHRFQPVIRPIETSAVS
jgi:hypothetical protein